MLRRNVGIKTATQKGFAEMRANFNPTAGTFPSWVVSANATLNNRSDRAMIQRRSPNALKVQQTLDVGKPVYQLREHITLSIANLGNSKLLEVFE